MSNPEGAHAQLPEGYPYLDTDTQFTLEQPDFEQLRQERLQRNRTFVTALNADIHAQALLSDQESVTAPSREETAVLCIQKYFRGYLGRKKYIELLFEEFQKEELEQQEKARRQVEEGELLVENHRLEVLIDESKTTRRNHERLITANVICIQRWWRACRQRQPDQRAGRQRKSGDEDNEVVDLDVSICDLADTKNKEIQHRHLLETGNVEVLESKLVTEGTQSVVMSHRPTEELDFRDKSITNSAELLPFAKEIEQFDIDVYASQPSDSATNIEKLDGQTIEDKRKLWENLQTEEVQEDSGAVIPEREVSYHSAPQRAVSPSGLPSLRNSAQGSNSRCEQEQELECVDQGVDIAGNGGSSGTECGTLRLDGHNKCEISAVLNKKANSDLDSVIGTEDLQAIRTLTALGNIEDSAKFELESRLDDHGDDLREDADVRGNLQTTDVNGDQNKMHESDSSVLVNKSVASSATADGAFGRTLPEMNWALLEEELKKAQIDEESKSRRNDREEIRKKLAMGVEEETYTGERSYTGDRSYKKSNLQSRLQGGMNLQICFMNESPTDTGTDSELANSAPMSCSASGASLDGSNASSAGASPRPTDFLDKDNNPKTTLHACSADNWTVTGPADEDDKNFFGRQARLREEAKMALAQASTMAHMQLEIERQTQQKKSPMAEVVGIPGLGEKRRKKLSLRKLHDMNLAQIQVLYNDLQTQIEALNEELVQLLMERDELHMEQDSRLVDIEDLQRRAEELAENLNSKEERGSKQGR